VVAILHPPISGLVCVYGYYPHAAKPHHADGISLLYAFCRTNQAFHFHDNIVVKIAILFIYDIIIPSCCNINKKKVVEVKRMKREIYECYTDILNTELVPALGCTEPIAIAFASAKTVSLLGCRPEKIEMHCSGNIVKNVQGVIVPNAGGLKGIEAAAILGALGGDADRNLEVLEGIDSEVKAETKELIGTGYCSCVLAEDVENLYLLAKVSAGEHSAEVEIEHIHTNIIRMSVDGKDLMKADTDQCGGHTVADKSLLNVRDILEFADTADLKDIEEVLYNQIEMNSAISDEGLEGQWGVSVGKTLLEIYGDDVKVRARARAAAGSDARMSGCSMPVVINSGSGNQGMTASLPVIEYATELGVSKEKLYRALVISNLIALHQKKYIGSLSAYCGVVCAACGSGAAITYLHGGGYEEIGNTIINTIANVGGMVCDGAKPSCAAKIASAVEAAILAHHMGTFNRVFRDGEGLVQQDVEQTIQNIGHVGRVGMKSTDLEILNIMLTGRNDVAKNQDN